MSPVRRLILVRHGESAWNAEHRLQGQADPPLSDLGRRQAAGLEAVLSAIPVDGAIASDLGRARETAVLAGFPDAPADARWREIGLGKWTGRLAAGIPRGDLERWRQGRLVPEGGESWPAFVERVAAAIEEVATSGGDRLVFTHGGCVRAGCAHVTGAPVEAFAGPANASVTVLELVPRRRVLAFNRADEDGFPRTSEPGGWAPAIA